MKNLVGKINETTINKMLAEKRFASLIYFLLGLAMSCSILNQTYIVNCLVNIGDWARRMLPENLLAARRISLFIFTLAENFRIKQTIPKLLTAKAMVFVLPDKTGIIPLGGIRTALKILNQAINAAKEFKDKKTELWAGHRLVGIAARWGDFEQKQSTLKLIDNLLPMLKKDNHDEYINFLGSKAEIIADSEPEEAAKIFVYCADAREQEERIADSFFLYYLAAECYFRINNFNLADKYLQSAEQHVIGIGSHVYDDTDINKITTLRQQIGSRD